MDNKLFSLVLILFGTLSNAYHHHDNDEEDFYQHTHSDEHYDLESDEEYANSDEEYERKVDNNDNEVPNDNETKNIETTETSINTKIRENVTVKPAGKYDVTENVIDVPNNVTVLGPVLTNFTINTPLHIINNTNINNTVYTTALDHYHQRLENVSDREAIKNLRKNFISILHIKAEYEDKQKPFVNVVQNVNMQNRPWYPGVKEYFNGIREGFSHGYNALVNKEVKVDVNHGVSVPNVVAGPVLFLSKLHQKGSIAASKLHQAIFGQNEDY